MAVPFIARAVVNLARKAKLPTTGSAAQTVERVRKLKNLGAATDLKFIESQARQAITAQASRYRTGKQTGGVEVDVDPSTRYKIDPWDVVTDIVSGKTAAEAARDALVPAIRLKINFITPGGRTQPRIIEGAKALRKAEALGEFRKELERLRDFRNLGPRVRQSLAQKYGLTIDEAKGVAYDMFGFEVDFATVEDMANRSDTPEVSTMVDPAYSAQRHRTQLSRLLNSSNELLANLAKSMVNSGMWSALPRVSRDIYSAMENKSLSRLVEFFESGVLPDGKYAFLSSDQHIMSMNVSSMVRAAGLNPNDYEFEELNM